jgi:hypothetical protein
MRKGAYPSTVASTTSLKIALLQGSEPLTSFTWTRSLRTATSYFIPRRPACRTSHTWVLSRRTPSFLVAPGRGTLVGTAREKSCRIICRRMEWICKTERRGICNSKEAKVCDTVSRTGATTYQNRQDCVQRVAGFGSPDQRRNHQSDQAQIRIKALRPDGCTIFRVRNRSLRLSDHLKGV